ncbi:MAG: hypothetical protein ACOCRX_05320 [Candidatus Woesearchaeota archaeon]
MKEIKNVEYVQYAGLKNQDVILVGKYNSSCDFDGALFYKDVETDLYKGYIYVEVGYNHMQNKYHLENAYLELKGKEVFLLEQKHFNENIVYNASLYFNTVEESILLMQEVIKYLEDYLSSNWLENKPCIKGDVIHYSNFKDRFFSYNGNNYITVINPEIAMYHLVNQKDFVVGNEIYRIAN